jgi:hypothetical protein
VGDVGSFPHIMQPHGASRGKQNEVIRHVARHSPKVGIGERSGEAVNLSIGQPVVMSHIIHHTRGRDGQKSVGRVL